MYNFRSLYFVELKKIASKKMVWIAMAAGLAVVLLVGMMNYSADGGGAYLKYQSDTLAELSGQKMDEAFFENFRQTVDVEIHEHPERYEKIHAYDPGAIFMNAASNIGLEALYDSIYNVLRDRGAVETVTAGSFYEAMRQNIIHDGNELGVTEPELAIWLEEYDSIEKPIAYSYALSYTNLLDVLFLVGWMLFLNITVALCGLFADENHYRTDALILSSRNGRLPVSIAKLAAGISVALLQAVLLLGGCFGVVTAFYGTTGWNAQIQNVIPSSPWNITIGGMITIYILLAIVISILFAMASAALSHLTKSATATMAVQAAVLFAGLFNVPDKMGWVTKIWQLRPTMALYYGTFCNTFRYGACNDVTLSLILYITASVLLAIYLILSCKTSQVGSR